MVLGTGLAALLIALAALLVPLAFADHDHIAHGAPAPPHRPSAPADPRTRHSSHASMVGRATSLPQAALTISPKESATPVPSSWFGISTEYWALPLFERDMPVFERVLALLHVPGDGPLVLRIGGDSADHSFWDPRVKRMPEWAFELTPAYLARLRSLVRRDRVKLIVDLNLLTDTPLTAAAWARAAETQLPHGSIVAFEVGNEPDLYSRRYWVSTLAGSPFRVRPLPIELSPSTYVEDFAAYARALGEHAPDIPLVGPAVAHPRISARFISTLIQDERPELGGVTGHLYPYSACVKRPRSASYPTVARLLSRRASDGLTGLVASAVTAAHAAGLTFRLTELNSVTCGGKHGVSDTFATALWAPDALFTLMRAGVDGANLHVRADAVNAAFAVTRRGLRPHPLLYGLLLFERTLGPRARLVRLHLTARRSLDVSAWAVRVRGGALHVLVLDKGNRTVQVNLHLPTTGPATVQRLLAPSPYSRSHATLDGQVLGADARWYGRRDTMRIAPRRRGYELIVPRDSAALLGARIRPGALSPAPARPRRRI